MQLSLEVVLMNLKTFNIAKNKLTMTQRNAFGEALFEEWIKYYEFYHGHYFDAKPPSEIFNRNITLANNRKMIGQGMEVIAYQTSLFLKPNNLKKLLKKADRNAERGSSR